MLLENTIIRLWLPTLGLLCLAWLASILRARIIYKRMMRQHGCKEIPSYPQKDPILGLDLLNVYKKAFEDKTFLDTNKRHFEVYGKTFRTTLLGKTIIKTSDPEVSKAFHATSFDKFGLEPLRLHIAPNFFGNGVILVDGRALIRSSFDVVHIANFERLQRHTSRFMNLLPKDETTVDLAPLLKLLVVISRTVLVITTAHHNRIWTFRVNSYSANPSTASPPSSSISICSTPSNTPNAAAASAPSSDRSTSSTGTRNGTTPAQSSRTSPRSTSTPP